MARKRVDNIDDRSRHFRLMLYPDNSIHSVLIDRLLSGKPIFDSSDKVKFSFIGIKHEDIDFEGGVKPHYHVFLEFSNAVYTRALCKRLGFVGDDGLPDDQFCRVIKGQFSNALVYLTHLNSPDKEQYERSALFGSSSLISAYDKAALAYVTKKVDKRSAFQDVCYWISSQTGIITAFQMLNYLLQTSCFAIRNESWLKLIWQEHNQRIIQAYNREIQNKISEDADKWASLCSGGDFREISPEEYDDISRSMFG